MFNQGRERRLVPFRVPRKALASNHSIGDMHATSPSRQAYARRFSNAVTVTGRTFIRDVGAVNSAREFYGTHSGGVRVESYGRSYGRTASMALASFS